MSGESYTDYDEIFAHALEKCCAKAAEVLYPYVTDTSVVNIYTILRKMEANIDSIDHDDKIPTILQNYLGVFKLLENVNYKINVNEFSSGLFYISIGNYDIYGKHPLYRRIIEIVYSLHGESVSRQEIGSCIISGYNGGILLLEDMNLLTEHDMSDVIHNYMPHSGFLEILEIFLKYQWLTNDNLSSIFRSFFNFNRYTRITDFFLGNLDKFIEFIIKHNFCIKIDAKLLSCVYDYNVLSKIFNLNTEHFIFNYDNTLIYANTKESYNLLLSRGYNVYEPHNDICGPVGSTGPTGPTGCTGPTEPTYRYSN